MVLRSNFLNDPVYRNSGILSSMEAIKRGDQKRGWDTRRTIVFGNSQVYVIAHPSVKSKILARMRSSCGRTLRRNHMGI
jgi:hypothetical protein